MYLKIYESLLLYQIIPNSDNLAKKSLSFSLKAFAAENQFALETQKVHQSHVTQRSTKGALMRKLILTITLVGVFLISYDFR